MIRNLPISDRVDWDQIDWNEPDNIIAEAVGVSRSLVNLRRHQLKHPTPKRRPRRTIYKRAREIDVMAGKMSDRDVAARLGVTAELVMRRRKQTGTPSYRTVAWTNEMIARLGKEPDSKLATEFHISTLRIAEKRRELGIPAFKRALT